MLRQDTSADRSRAHPNKVSTMPATQAPRRMSAPAPAPANLLQAQPPVLLHHHYVAPQLGHRPPKGVRHVMQQLRGQTGEGQGGGRRLRPKPRLGPNQGATSQPGLPVSPAQPPPGTPTHRPPPRSSNTHMPRKTDPPLRLLPGRGAAPHAGTSKMPHACQPCEQQARQAQQACHNRVGTLLRAAIMHRAWGACSLASHSCSRCVVPTATGTHDTSRMLMPAVANAGGISH